jgi:hypothetical protein
MGACSFVVYATGKDLKDAYLNAVKGALINYSEDSYNGSVSTTTGVEDVTHLYPKYGTAKFKTALVEALNALEKGMPCLAVEIKGAALKEFCKNHGLERRRIKAFVLFGVAAC